MKRIYFVLGFLLFVGILFPVKMAAMAVSSLVIDEFRVDGATTNDEYVVIANYGDSVVDLNLYSLTIKNTATTYSYLYRFAFGASIKPNEKIRICHNSVSDRSLCNLFNTGTSYSLKESNVIALIANSSTTKNNIDIVGYGELDYGVSGCWSTGCEEYPLDTPAKNTPFRRINGVDTNRSNIDFQPVIAPVFQDPNRGMLRVTEILPAPETGEEWVEIFNPTSQTVLLSGLKLCDAMGSVHCYYFSKDAVLKPFEYKSYSQSETKITLNNSGDWVELRDISDNLISDSGGDYGSADSGVSLALFGDEFRWTKTITPAAENIYLDTIELESTVVTKAKSTSKKVKAATPKKIASSIADPEEEDMAVAGAVSEARIADTPSQVTKVKVSNSLLGYSLIVLAFALLLGYNLWDQRDAIRKIYNKISRRDS